MILSLLSLLSVVTACANSNREDRGRGGQQGPPPEAIAACEGKAEGDSVTFKGRRGESMKATCEVINDQLAAVPEKHKRD
ncbi:hypothetical protein [Desulfopila sp. IMCC35008]|uniref:hypothetical protein n=1 Tax=Desulfopila sp. IMCC35008 TaxID=2653858 RepID=UPI0013D7AFE1|nr:hypothetical protein [Desulfopila sp. IMCC35008]